MQVVSSFTAQKYGFTAATFGAPPRTGDPDH
jgi:hypothetical protein